jgi:hypothetical protein
MDSRPPESDDPMLIAAELQEKLNPKIYPEFVLPESLTKQKNENLENEYLRILKIADDITINNRLNVSYSNFHTWEHLRQFETGKEASGAAMPSTFQSFQNCFYMANECAEALRTSLKAEGLSTWARQVKLATDCWAQRPTSARQYHCIVMLCCADRCIVIDPVAFFYAIEVAVNNIWSSDFSTYSYCYAAAGNSRFLVHVDDINPQNVLARPTTKDFLSYNDPFREVRGGLKGGIENLVFPTDSYRGRLPSNRSILVDSVWDREPETDITYFPLQDGSRRFLVETCRIGIDIRSRSMWISAIPQEWLARKENSKLLRRLKNRNGYGDCADKPEVHAAWQLELTTLTDIQNGFTKRTMSSLTFMQELAEALGLKAGELIRIANAVLSYWQEEEQKKSQKNLKRKRSEIYL